ncbi:MAG: carboxypeptidase regulatory-like domain-containing protein [Acidobacteriota bacterium]|nr:carboxypeptidase regulatory-like domain-containing protein [Acidobacteriota bacterium]
MTRIHKAEAGRFSRKLRALLTIAAAFALLFSTSSIWAQIAGTGTISGTVADASGAVVAGAQVTATNNGTHLAFTQSTSSAGAYTLTTLPPGDYTVTVQAKGFESSRQQVTLNALTQLGVNISLQAGSTEQVVVTAQAPELQTENGQNEITIPNSTYEALPVAMNGAPKSAIGFLSLVPGVTQNNQFGSPVINGGIIASSLIYVNGLPLASAELQGGIENLNTITTEVIDQFQVISSGVPANYDGQGIINLSYKSGTNQFHGTIFENIRNTAFDAPGFGNKKAPVEHQNEYGATLGGPIIRDRIFFFGSYDGYKITSGNTPVFRSIPTVAERTGDFSAFAPIYDPRTTKLNSAGILTRQQFPGNQVPVLSKVAQALQASLPTPQNGNIQNNYSNTFTNGNSQYVYLAKIDAKLTNKDRVSGLFQSGKSTPLSYGDPLPVPYSSARASASTWYIGEITETHVFTPNLLNYLGANLVRNESSVTNPTAGGGWPAKVGLTGLPIGQTSDIFPQISFGGVNQPYGWDQGNTGFGEIPTSETGQDNVQWVRGKHSFTFGGQITFEQEALRIPSQYTSGFNFSNNETAALDPVTGQPVPGTGSGYASFLLGLVDQAGFQDYAVEETGGRWQNYAVYAQDDWKVTPKLVVNLGLRYSIPKPFTEVHDRTSWLNPTTPNPLIDGGPGVLEFAGHGPNTCNCRTNVKTHYLTLGPRVGFAYSATPKTVIRSAFSIVHFNGGALGGNGEQQGVGNQGYATAPTFNTADGGITPAFQLDNGVPAYQHPPFFSPTLATGYNTAIPQGQLELGGVSYDRPNTAGRSPYTEEWNLTMEQEFPWSLIMNLTYAGTSSHFNGVNGGLGIYSNQIDPKYLALGSLLNTPQVTPAVLAQAQAQFPEIKLPYANYSGPLGQMLRPFAQYNAQGGTFQGPDPWSNFGTSSYNALQASLARSMRRGLYLLVSYTWSKTMDEGGDGVNFVASRPRTAYNLRAERSVSLLDVPQAISLTEVYTLPFGKGSMFDAHNPIVNGIIGNWQLSGTQQYGSGTPANPITGNCLVPYTGGCYADYNPAFRGDPHINGKIGSHLDLATPYFDKNAFQSAANYTLGNTPRTLAYRSLRNEGYKNENVSVAKTIPITERVNFQFKADAFNLFNRVQLGGINTDVTSSAFGQANGQANAPRQLQMEGYIRF